MFVLSLFVGLIILAGMMWVLSTSAPNGAKFLVVMILMGGCAHSCVYINDSDYRKEHHWYGPETELGKTIAAQNLAKFEAQKEVGMYSSSSDVLGLWGPPTRKVKCETIGPDSEFWIYIPRGICLEVNPLTGKVIQIIRGEPGTDTFIICG